MSDQLGLFGAATTARVGPAKVPKDIVTLAGHLPAELRMGTSSWSFPGWKGILYDRAADERILAQDGLLAYAQHPLLRAVGIDRSFYGPVSAGELRRYAAAVPADFRFLMKAHVDCTRARWPLHERYGAKSGQRNERFLDHRYATREVVEPYLQGLGSSGGVLLFQFPAQNIPGGPRAFSGRLREFFGRLPRGPRYAVEIRNPELMTQGYARALAEFDVSHCLTAHPTMPDLETQWTATGGEDRPALVVRWMLAGHHRYESAKDSYAPFDRLVDPDPGTRRTIADLIRRGSGASFLIVNNKAEGSSPLSIIELARHLASLD